MADDSDSSDEDLKREGMAPGVAQGTGMACQCMRGTVLLCHVVFLKDTWPLVQVCPCGAILDHF